MIRSILVLVISLSLASFANAKGPRVTDPSQADGDFALQGEYQGMIEIDGEEVKIGLQVIALGEGEFQFVGYPFGLPGDGWEKTEGTVEGKSKGTTAEFVEHGVEANLAAGQVTLDQLGQRIGVLKRVERKSPTLGAEPPSGATLLFDGSNADNWKDGKLDGDLLMQGTSSNMKLGSHRLHIEFRLPYHPQDRGQARGNSGIYLQGRYEVQMLDSFGLEGKHNECGGIYSIKAPDVNMCFPPLTWQTYDIEFHEAKYEGDKLVKNARMTVKHNGVVIHRDVELPKTTTAAPNKMGPDPGPIYLQDHSCQIRYRNIWVQPL